MIICPNCKEEIDDDSHYCDQCGQALLYCDRCGRVGLGRRCTNCGGLMITPEEYERRRGQHTAYSSSVSTGFVSEGFISTNMPTNGRQMPPSVSIHQPQGVPVLLLYNSSLNIRIQGINGAVLGRRQGPYVQFFQNNKYVSGVHAQLKYKADSGWCIADKHSSNGTRLNDRQLQPDVDMSLKNGDILTIANVNLQVSVS
ncbi:MAG: FHA domain-containing protein [Prevotella sp.]|nr:FHA domain-containing protein [Prevotella sp.]